MLARLWLFLPSIAVCIVISGFAHLILSRVARYINTRTKNDPEWIKKNKIKTFWMVSIPAFLIWAPFFEELIFRGVLVVCFESVTLWAFVAIVVSAALFAYAHKSSVIEYHEQAYEKENLEDKTIEELLKDREELDRKIKRDFRKKFFWTFVGGLIFGLTGVYSQSIYASVFFHFAWNFSCVILAFAVQTLLGSSPDMMILKHIYRPKA
jgi:membrane protease YdiL (CAAX protease family)